MGGDRIELSLPSFSYASLSPPGVQSLDVFNYLQSFLGVLYLIDTVYRLWLSVRVIRRHWSQSLVDTPLCDVRSYLDENDREISNVDNQPEKIPQTHWLTTGCGNKFPVFNKTTSSSFGAILTLLTNAWVHVLIVVGVITFAIYCLLGISTYANENTLH